jgi:leucyl aminopeptidase
MEKMGMGALLSVAQGSDHPPKLVILEFKPDKRVESEPVAVIGKGVTFDSGGISLKPARNMDEMKFDMSGAAVVMGVMKAVAALKPSVSVVGVMPLVENLPSGKATKPGDIVKSYSGKTIEIQNTDAEGRLILADAISYVQKSYKPAFLLDLATLTGAVVVALGHAAAGIMGGDGRALEELVEIGNKVGERVWPLPLYDEYADQLKSSVADLRNVGGGPAGVTVGGAFLANFVEDRKKWIHIDIAGVAWTKEDKPLARKGATGFGVRLVVEWIETVAEKRILR